jgi:hypothetical protein
MRPSGGGAIANASSRSGTEFEVLANGAYGISSPRSCTSNISIVAPAGE